MIALLTDWRAWLVAICAGLVLTNCTTRNLLEREKLAHEKSRAAFDETVRQANRAHAAAEDLNRNIERDLIHANTTRAQAVQAVLDAAKDDARRDAADRERLHGELAVYAQRARETCADPAPVAAGATAQADPLGVFANMLARADGRASELAQFADDARTRGLACESEYNAAREAVNASAAPP